MQLIRAKSSKKYDYVTALAAAKRFHETARVRLERYKIQGTITPAEVFVSGTNYGLALELYLKSLLVMEGASDVHGHNLEVLFGKLTHSTQENITKKYEEAGGLERGETLYIRARLSESSNQADAHSTAPVRCTKLKQLLRNNRDIFIVFRYMFERGRNPEWEYFYLEYSNLDIAIAALSGVSEQFLNEAELGKINAM